MVTVAVEYPTVNAAVQLGPMMTAGLGGADGKGFGLRSGAMGAYDTAEENILCLGRRAFVPTPLDRERGKGYEFDYLWLPGLFPNAKAASVAHATEGKWFNSWQFEAALGCVLGLRVGVNLAEILDSLLGWFCLDICDDDIATTEEGRPLKYP